MHQPIERPDNKLRIVQTSTKTYIGFDEGKTLWAPFKHPVLGMVRIPHNVMRPVRCILRSRSKYIPGGPHRNVKG